MRRLKVVVGVLALITVSTARSRAQRPDADPVRIETVAEKLGVKLSPNAGAELELGKSVTGSLDDPTRIEKYGIKAMHQGARVTITLVAPGRIRVEADEMDPVAQDKIVTLQVAADGSLTAAPTPPKPPSSKPPV